MADNRHWSIAPALVAAALMLASCTTTSDGSGVPATVPHPDPTAPSSSELSAPDSSIPESSAPDSSAPDSSAPTISVAPTPGWLDADECPAAQQLSGPLGVEVTGDADDELYVDDGSAPGPGCRYQLSETSTLEVIVMDQSIDYFRSIFANPPPTTVIEAPELGDGAIIAVTPPAIRMRQCLVLGTLAEGTLMVQVTISGSVSDTELCAPLGPTLAVLAST